MTDAPRRRATKPKAAPAAAGITEPASRSAALETAATRNAAVMIAVVAAGAVLYWLRGILTPLALAVFLMIMIDGFARFLRARLPVLPGWGALTLALAVAVAGFVIAAVIIGEYASSFASEIISYGPRLNDLIGRLASMVGIDTPPSVDQLFERLNPARYIGRLAQSLQNFVSNALFVLVYLGFLIASRAGFARKVVRLFPDRTERGAAQEAFERIRLGVERYLWIQTVTGALIAVASWAVMAVVGLDNAFFWAFLIFVAGFIPIIGGAVGCILPPVIALVQFDVLWPAVVLLIALNVINFLVGNVLLPRMQGDSLNLDPVVVLLALAFWGAIWGVAGMFLSTPLAVMAMVILAQFRGTRWIAVLLSGDGDPLGEDKPKPRKGSRNLDPSIQ